MSESSAQGFDPVLFEPLLAAEDRNFWFRVRGHIIAAMLKRLSRGAQSFDAPAFHRVLEIGCGTGNVLRTIERLLPNTEVIGLEMFEEGVEIARNRVRSKVLLGDLESYAGREPCDLIGMFDVLEHIEDDVAALWRIREYLTSEGVLLLTVPCNPKLWSAFDVAAKHFRRYTKVSLTAALRSGGFDVQYISPFMMLLLPVMKLRRSAPERGPVDAVKVIDSELAVPAFANTLAYIMLLPEVLWIRLGGKLPLGTSLLAVARPASNAVE